MKRHASTIVLFVLAVVLAAWLWRDRDKPTSGERKSRDNDVFAVWRKEDLGSVEIAHEGETILLVRDPKTDSPWRMKSPREERVDQNAVERLLTTLEFATVVRKVAGGEGLGLEAPRARGEVTMGAITMRFALGSAAPRPEGASYLRVDDRPPFVVSKELTEALLASSDRYRDRTVVPYLSIELARFEVKHPGGGFAVVRTDDRSFKVEGPGVHASRSALDKVWGALAEMRAEAFPRDADADRLTAQPRLTITMTPKDAHRTAGEIVVGDGCPGHPADLVVLRRQPARVAACAPKGAIEALLAATPERLVDKLPFGFRHDEVEELRLERVGGADAGAAGLAAFEIARRGTGFHQREPVDRELPAEEASAAGEMLVQIEHGAAEEVRAGGAPFAAIARAKMRSGAHEEVVEVGADANGRATLLRRLRDDARLTVAPAVGRRLMPRATTARDRRIVHEERKAKRVVLRCGTPQELVDDGRGFALVEPKGYEADGTITQLVAGILEDKAIAWVADADDGSFGLDFSSATVRSADRLDLKDPCRVVIAFADERDPLTIRFGAEGEGGVYAVLDGKPEVFVAPLSLRTLARRVYVSHATLRVEPARVESVRVTVAGKPVTRDPSALRFAAGGLFAERVVSLGTSDVGAVDVEIVIKTSEGGSDKRVSCGALADKRRRCAAAGVKAVFEVLPAAIDAFIHEPAAGDARDR